MDISKAMHPLLALGSLGLLTYLQAVSAEQFLNNVTQPHSSFFTRPQAMPPAMNISVSLPGQADGLVFIGAYASQYSSPGPRIYDKKGNLVWDGYGILPGNCHNVHVCNYQGEPHICLVQNLNPVGWGAGVGLILDTDYRIAATVQVGQSATFVDQHEFQVLADGKTAIVSFYKTVPCDLSYFNMTAGLGYLLEAGFQEIDIDSGAVMYEWYAMNHVDPSETRLLPNTSDTSGTGTTGTSGFDYFHLNSVDKSVLTGHYLISARHTGTIYLINGTSHDIIWRLSYVGPSDFEIQGFNFSYQHDARFVSENDTTTVISFFDNAWNGYSGPGNGFENAATAPTSSGKIIALDHTKGTASLLSITYPPSDTTSLSQGNTQILDNGNVFHGWGDVPEFTEHDENGTVILWGSFASAQFAVMNYRAFSFNTWSSTPTKSVPTVYSYALNESAPTAIYVSWNGATTVDTWRYYGLDPAANVYNVIGNTSKNGFETLWTSPTFFRYVMVEALDSDGKSLANSSYQPTFTPSQAMIVSCTETGCAALPTDGYINANVSEYSGFS